jgi:hypothetical protein
MLQVVEKVPPYVDVRLVAVATTVGSGAGAATKAAELESTASVEAVADGVNLLFAAIGFGAGAAIGLRSVVASTTI